MLKWKRKFVPSLCLTHLPEVKFVFTDFDNFLLGRKPKKVENTFQRTNGGWMLVGWLIINLFEPNPIRTGLHLTKTKIDPINKLFF
jgi:hypothetical protein